MSTGPVTPRLFSVLICTRPARESISRPLVIALIAHLLVAAGMIKVDDVRLPLIFEPQHNGSVDDSPILLKFVDALKPRASGGAPRPAARPRSPIAQTGDATLPLTAGLELPELAQVEAALAQTVDSLARAFAAAAWVFPLLPTLEEMNRDVTLLARAPRITAYSRAPVMTNRKEIEKFLKRRFPFRLRQLGGEARALLWLLIDVSGHVHRAELSESSGRIDVDSVALASAQQMEFLPAQHAGEPVPVWVQLPVGFRVVDE
jgi:TonB family protein